MELEARTGIKRIRPHGEKPAATWPTAMPAPPENRRLQAQVVGAQNLAAGLRDAYLAHSPVIAMTGGRDAKTKFKRLSGVDDLPSFDTVTKFNATIEDVERIPTWLPGVPVAVSGRGTSPSPVRRQRSQIDQDEAAWRSCASRSLHGCRHFGRRRPTPS